MDAINSLEFLETSILKVDERFMQLMNQYLVSRIYAVSSKCPDNMIELWLYNWLLKSWHQGISGDIEIYYNSIDQEELNTVLTKALQLVK